MDLIKSPGSNILVPRCIVQCSVSMDVIIFECEIVASKFWLKMPWVSILEPFQCNFNSPIWPFKMPNPYFVLLVPEASFDTPLPWIVLSFQHPSYCLHSFTSCYSRFCCFPTTSNKSEIGRRSSNFSETFRSLGKFTLILFLKAALAFGVFLALLSKTGAHLFASSREYSISIMAANGPPTSMLRITRIQTRTSSSPQIVEEIIFVYGSLVTNDKVPGAMVYLQKDVKLKTSLLSQHKCLLLLWS